MKIVIAVILGGMAGFLLHKLIGCTSGACPLIGSPFISIAYGGFLGFLLMGSFRKDKKDEGQS